MPFRASDDKKLEEKIRAVDYRFPKRKCATDYLTEVKDFITKLLRKRTSERLCSHKYSDYLNHKLFEGLDNEKLERGNFNITYHGVTELMNKSAKGFSPIISPTLEREKDNYVRPEKIKDVSDHCALLTFVSKQFQDIVVRRKTKQPVTLESYKSPGETWVVRPHSSGSRPTDSTTYRGDEGPIIQPDYRFKDFLKDPPKAAES